MKQLYDYVSNKTSRITTNAYSTSFSMGIRFFHKRFHSPIYAIYGFVRLADEIVDTFDAYEQKKLLQKFRQDTWEAIKDGISLNPILHSFQDTVNKYGIDHQLITQFLKSMEMDLYYRKYDRKMFEEYILGSAEVVGLMCLQVFVQGDKDSYEQLKPFAMKLGAAFQKINFLRDLRADHLKLGRSYFPNVNLADFSVEDKRRIENEIALDFSEGLKGIRMLPAGARLGVYIAYVYFFQLFRKIRDTHPKKLMAERIRVPNTEKYSLLLSSYVRHRMNML